MLDKIFDFVGVGIGPFNLSLACLTDPIEGLDGIFLDKNSDFNWHPGLMFEQAHLQTPFMSDLVTLADPTSPYSFLNYIKQQGRLYSFYIREDFFLLRKEYNQYCQWAASKLSNVQFNTEVLTIQYSSADQVYEIHARCTKTGGHKIYRARKLVLGTGPVPYVPACAEDLTGHAIHASSYLSEKETLQKNKSITLLGSGQSAAEIFYDLLQDVDRYGYELSWITRSPRYFPLEYTKLTLEMTSPEYVDYFHQLPEAQRASLNEEHKKLAKGINGSLINEIFDLLYAKRLDGEVNVNLYTNSTLEQVQFNKASKQFELEFMQTELQQPYCHTSDGLIMATGYAYRTPNYVQGISGRIRWDHKGRYDVARFYSIDHDDNEIFVQNAEHHTHGFVTPDLGMACYRNSCIIRAITGEEIYPIEEQIAFQRFDLPVSELPKPKKAIA